MKKVNFFVSLIILSLICQLSLFSLSTTSSNLSNQIQNNKTEISSKKILKISDLDWKYGKFVKNWTNPFIPLAGGGYECEINKTVIHMKEIGPETYNSQLTCYTLVNLHEEKIALSFEFKAKSVTPNECDFLFYLVDPITNISLKYPKIELPRLKPNAESDFNKASIETVLEGHDQILLVFICRDNSPLYDEQEFWIQKLRYYIDGELPDTFPRSYSSFNDLEWRVGLFGWYPVILPEQQDTIIDYNYEINDTHMFFEETGTRAFQHWVGASTNVKTRGKYFSISFDAKMQRDQDYNGNFWVYFYDGLTRKIIFTAKIGMNLGDFDPVSDTGWVHFERKIDFSGYEDVIILFTHIDIYPSNIHSKFWVSNLKINPTQKQHTNKPLGLGELLTNYAQIFGKE